MDSPYVMLFVWVLLASTQGTSASYDCNITSEANPKACCPILDICPNGMFKKTSTLCGYRSLQTNSSGVLVCVDDCGVGFELRGSTCAVKKSDVLVVALASVVSVLTIVIVVAIVVVLIRKKICCRHEEDGKKDNPESQKICYRHEEDGKKDNPESQKNRNSYVADPTENNHQIVNENGYSSQSPTGKDASHVREHADESTYETADDNEKVRSDVEEAGGHNEDGGAEGDYINTIQARETAEGQNEGEIDEKETKVKSNITQKTSRLHKPTPLTKPTNSQNIQKKKKGRSNVDDEAEQKEDSTYINVPVRSDVEVADGHNEDGGAEGNSIYINTNQAREAAEGQNEGEIDEKETKVKSNFTQKTSQPHKPKPTTKPTNTQNIPKKEKTRMELLIEKKAKEPEDPMQKSLPKADDNCDYANLPYIGHNVYENLQEVK